MEFLNLAVANPKLFSTSFYNLKSLSLYILLNRYKQVKAIINLLNLSPNLEALTILIDWLDLSECWEIPDEVTCSAYHLKSVRLRDFGGSENELELVRFLLMKGQFLPLTVAKPECSAAFCNLKSLKLLVSVDESDQSTIQLLYCCPNLEALSIFFARLEDWVGGAIQRSATRPTWVICGKSIPLTDSCKMPNEDIPCLTYHLKKVELIDVACNKKELELVKFLLNNGRVLQKMGIRGRRFENPNKIVSKVMMFPRSSPDVVLTFYEPAI
ncbi:hypothetical protein Ddye_027358 [Dipteronia dyeriana]|uniref:FBD domain-containing protein n=1 Tax=Dipteronia dyeriana TaxID=168575 RepID=A0AAD9TPR8_9ROSI|nr:hypothetical protein Ddye_027358 [Dipteronia dyeriana]